MIDVQLKHIIDNQYSEMSYKKVPMTENCTDMSIDFPKDITSFDISRQTIHVENQRDQGV
jgi:hypothetical protein